MGSTGSTARTKEKAGGVEIRERSIRITFTLDGRLHRETVRTGGEPIPPTPANLRYAKRLAAEIRDKIRFGTFVYADYFPASPSASTGQGSTVGEQLALWLKLQHAKEPSTLKGYGIAVSWWTRSIGTKPLRALRHSDILGALATQPTWSGKTRNNKVSVLRQALDLAIRDDAIRSNPVAGIEAAPHQSPAPDPFSLEEVEAILTDLRSHYDPQVGNYFEAKFFTGMRTSESLGLRWPSLDWRLGQALVAEGIVLGQHKTTTKTHRTRIVQLNSRALAALRAQKAHTFMIDPQGWAFLDPKTGKRWVDDWTPREMYWRPTLTRLGIRYRSPYQTRHTYASMMLMAGMTPAFCAKQLGHSVEMFLRTYSKWIDGGRNDVEMDKLEGLLGGEVSRTIPRNRRTIAK
jgi:integrase